jgi:hypothetical protein
MRTQLPWKSLTFASTGDHAILRIQEGRASSAVAQITQIKGDGEAHPLLSPDDAFADYETGDAGNVDLSESKTEEMLQYDYARHAAASGVWNLEGQAPCEPPRVCRRPYCPGEWLWGKATADGVEIRFSVEDIYLRGASIGHAR